MSLHSEFGCSGVCIFFVIFFRKQFWLSLFISSFVTIQCDHLTTKRKKNNSYNLIFVADFCFYSTTNTFFDYTNSVEMYARSKTPSMGTPSVYSIHASHLTIRSSNLRSTRSMKSLRVPWYQRPILKDAYFLDTQRGALVIAFYSLVSIQSFIHRFICALVF